MLFFEPCKKTAENVRLDKKNQQNRRNEFLTLLEYNKSTTSPPRYTKDITHHDWHFPRYPQEKEMEILAFQEKKVSLHGKTIKKGHDIWQTH
jgi:hypothetical protein